MLLNLNSSNFFRENQLASFKNLAYLRLIIQLIINLLKH